MPPADRTLPLGHEDLEIPRHRRDADEDAEERGHRRGRCPNCGRGIWSEDTGYFECPSCGPEPVEHREEDDDA